MQETKWLAKPKIFSVCPFKNIFLTSVQGSHLEKGLSTFVLNSLAARYIPEVSVEAQVGCRVQPVWVEEFCHWQRPWKVAHYHLDLSSITCSSNKEFIHSVSIYSLHINHLYRVFVSLFFHLQDAEMFPLKFFYISVITIWLISGFLSFILFLITTMVIADILNILDQVLSFLHMVSYNPHENPKNI